MIKITQEWVDKAKKLANKYAYDYSFVGDASIKRSRDPLFEHLQSILTVSKRTIRVTLQNGDVIKIPEPVRDALNFGQAYWAFEPETLAIYKFEWHGHNVELIGMSENRIFRTEEDALVAQAAINAIMSQLGE